MSKNAVTYFLMGIMFVLPYAVLATAVPAFSVFWAEEFNKELFEILYNLTFVLSFIVSFVELATAITGIALSVIAYKNEEIKRFPIVRVIYFILCQGLFSAGTFILSFLTVHAFTYGMGI